MSAGVLVLLILAVLLIVLVLILIVLVVLILLVIHCKFLRISVVRCIRFHRLPIISGFILCLKYKTCHKTADDCCSNAACSCLETAGEDTD